MKHALVHPFTHSSSPSIFHAVMYHRPPSFFDVENQLAKIPGVLGLLTNIRLNLGTLSDTLAFLRYFLSHKPEFSPGGLLALTMLFFG